MQASEIRWASRWDTYLLMMDDQIHWFSIINSLMIVLFLSGMVAMIMMRTLHRDISKYNQLDSAEEAQEETGWKLVSPPPPPFPLSLPPKFMQYPSKTYPASTILVHNLHCDNSNYNQLDSAEEAQGESGWRLVSHPPPPCAGVSVALSLHRCPASA